MKHWLLALSLICFGSIAGAQIVPDDVFLLSQGNKLALGVTNNYNVDACIQRELHDGQWLAGGCKDVFFILRKNILGADVKAFHFGIAWMSNAEHGNTSFQFKAGVDLGTVGASLGNAIAVVAPTLSEWGTNLPPWTSKVGEAITFDFAGGYRPSHDSSVNGNWAYGPMIAVNVPIQTTFEWLIKGL